ncbi:hypothetical protein [Desulfovibrio piger]|uniref:hypothetical protein n=1 Tax=Desulfovibrio piger TaxID=901 RepID=UPI003F0E8584
MALSEKEKDWLERRKKNEKEYGSVYCPCCEQFNPEWDLYLGYCNDSTDCALTEHDFRDAAEFEARVARELSDPTGGYIPLCMPDDCDFHDRHNCRACRLMFARLAAEAEMDK